MSDPLYDFIISLDKDPQLQDEYRKAPRETLEKNGIAEKDINMLLEGDIKTIKERLGVSNITALVIISL